MTQKCVHRARLIRKNAGNYIGYSFSAMEKRASKGLAPVYHMEKGKAYYYLDDLEAFEQSQQVF